MAVPRTRPRWRRASAPALRRVARRPMARQHGRRPPAGQGQDSVQRFAWYVGLALMAALEVIDWPVAIVIGVGHEIGHRARPRAVRELAGGVQAARFRRGPPKTPESRPA